MTAFSDLAQATAWVFDLQKFGIKFGLSSTRRLLARLGGNEEHDQLVQRCRHRI